MHASTGVVVDSCHHDRAAATADTKRMKTITLDCLWLPPSHGGRRTDPHAGLRLGIRWQRHVRESLEFYRDAQFDQLAFDPTTRRGLASLKLVSDVPVEWLRHGELVEILEGFQVVAVGTLICDRQS